MVVPIVISPETGSGFEAAYIGNGAVLLTKSKENWSPLNPPPPRKKREGGRKGHLSFLISPEEVKWVSDSLILIERKRERRRRRSSVIASEFCRRRGGRAPIHIPRKGGERRKRKRSLNNNNLLLVKYREGKNRTKFLPPLTREGGKKSAPSAGKRGPAICIHFSTHIGGRGRGNFPYV